MKQKQFTSKDGKEGIEYRPESNDFVVCNASSVYESEPIKIVVGRGTAKERNVEVTNYGIYASWNGKDIFLKLTKGLKTYLNKCGDLLGKTLVFGTYKNDFGNQLGVQIKSNMELKQ